MRIVDCMSDEREVAEIIGIRKIAKHIFVDPDCAHSTNVGQQVVLNLHYVAPLIYITHISYDCLIESECLKVDFEDLDLVLYVVSFGKKHTALLEEELVYLAGRTYICKI